MPNSFDERNERAESNAQVIQLQQSNAQLLAQLSMAEQGRRNMFGKLSMIREKCTEATAENSALLQEITATRSALAVRNNL